jgi:hypothetical protein
VQVWGNLESLCDELNLASLIAALIAVKVFLNDAVGIIGKLAPVLWSVLENGPARK